MTYCLADIRGRKQFPSLLKDKDLLGLAVEIGTHRGKFARYLLDHWPGMMLYCVDIWAPYDNSDPASIGDRGADKQAAIIALSIHEHRRQILHMSSLEACTRFEDQSVDFVYVDGCHQKESIRQDLFAWWDKVRPGGFLGGHDIICPNTPKSGWGQYTQPVLQEFAKERNLDIHLVFEPDNDPWSFYMEKPL